MLSEVTASDHPYLLYIALGGLLMLGPALNSWLSFVKGLRAEKINAGNFVTHNQLAEMEHRLTSQINQTVGAIKEQVGRVVSASDHVTDQMSELKDAVNQEITALHRAIGTLEGLINRRTH